MSVYALQDTLTGPLVVGVVVFPQVEESGTFNVYGQFSSDLAPFQPTIGTDSVQFWKTTYFVEGVCEVDDFSRINKFAGFPDRYKLGSYRWQAGNRSQRLHFIDTLRWSEDLRHTTWVSVGVAPERDFLTEESTSLTSYDALLPLSYSDGIETTQAALCAAETISYDLEPFVRMQFNIQYAARYIEIGPFEGVPQDVFLPFI